MFEKLLREHGSGILIISSVSFLVLNFVVIISMLFWIWIKQTEKPTEFTNNGKVCIQIDHNVYCKEELICKPIE